MRNAWRIATQWPGSSATDMRGDGAFRSGGRWNSKGQAVLYAASSISLACLETLAHLNAAGLPLRRVLVRFDIPEDLWAAAERFDPKACPQWDVLPAGPASRMWGDAWLRDTSRPALAFVPSVIVPEEFNILINPAHPDVSRLKAVKLRSWDYDARLV